MTEEILSNIFSPVLFDFQVGDPDVGGEMRFLGKLCPTRVTRMDLPVFQTRCVGSNMLVQPLPERVLNSFGINVSRSDLKMSTSAVGYEATI